ncbi:hypothetical protein CMV_003845 [Castanea mollissima]|uniref:Hemerythrin-like domain-containing protein n=1 Tax=Castanea mollissima TaxID=60419 RepID=A0A8J4RG80_9ROSI|nr:hypothetical protein CMV_003845 [Castanea mollissima]
MKKWNCFRKKSKKSTAEIVPHDVILNGTTTTNGTAATAAAAAAVVSTQSSTVRLYGSPTSVIAAYFRFALLHKGVSVRFIPSDTPNFGSDAPVLQIGSETVSGSRETVLRYIDARFPHPPLGVRSCDEEEEEETTPLVVRAIALQHKSITWHVERLVRWVEDLATRGGKGSVDPTVGSPRMEMKKLARSYSELLEVLLEHAQMEERVVFPILERADRGMCKAANEEHARDLPIMNGIKEGIKSIGVMDSGSPDYQEALSNLSTRLKSLQENSKQHFMEEDKDLLPFMEAVEHNKEQQKRVLEQCFDVMQGTHSHLFNFLLEGLLPREAMQYLDLFISCNDRERTASTLKLIVD